MAKVTLVFDDEASPSNPESVGVRMDSSVDRSNDVPGLEKFPATPAMIYALACKRLFESGGIDGLLAFVCFDVMTRAGLSPEQQAQIKQTVDKQLGVS